jgi:diguanylate cyclase (GGDEF)-like protein/PAS domain S-box-containing protein
MLRHNEPRIDRLPSRCACDTGGIGAARRASRVALARFALCFALLGTLHAQTSAAQAPLRHPLEERALIEPDAVIADLMPLIRAARDGGDAQELALLELARANACRVIADWSCQRDAGREAQRAARDAGVPLLTARALIAQARATIALQDYTQGARLLAAAEIELQKSPSAEFSADVDLAYSSLSDALGKHQAALDYADRGLRRLGEGEAVPMQARLLRNRARSLVNLERIDEARAALARGAALAAQVVDPKLSAEMYLGSARLAREVGDRRSQRENGERVLALAQKLENSQLAGLGHETLGILAMDLGDLPTARDELQTAHQHFRDLGLVRDELRAARELIAVLLDLDPRAIQLPPLLRRLFALDADVIQKDRAQAADDFDARIRYAQQEIEVLRLENEAALARARENALAATNRLTRFLIALSLAIVLVLAIFFVLQRRSNARLRGALNALNESQSRATDLLQLSTGYVFLHDRDGRLLMVNPATAEAIGIAPDALVGRNVREFLPADAGPEFDDYLQRVLSAGRDEGVLRIRARDEGERRWRYGNRLSRVDADSGYVVGHAIDVTEQIEETDALRERSERDPLTGSWNRRHLAHFEQHHAASDGWSVVNIDLDHFKQVNDTHGHERGDQVLVAFARFLQQRVRERDAVVRSGGDEFLVLLAGASAAALAALVERLGHDSGHAPCAFSLGWATRASGEALARTIERADGDMYRARAARRRAPGAG